MNENDQKQFISDLAQVLGVNSEEEFAAAIKPLQKALPKLFQIWKQNGKEGLTQAMGQAVSRRLGGQLNYLRILDGECVNGVEFHKKGGCMKCGGKAKTMQNGGEAKKRITKAEGGTPINPPNTQMPKRTTKRVQKQSKPVEKGPRSGAPMPTQYNAKQHDSLIRRFQGAPKTRTNEPIYSRTRNFTPASMDSLQWFNRHDPNDDGV